MSSIGVSDFKYAILQQDDETGVKYGEFTAIKGLVNIGVRPSSQTSTNYADNGAFEVANSLGEITISIESADLPDVHRAALLGHTLGENGEMIYGAEDDAPYVAIMFKGKTSSGKNKHVKVLKVKFAEINDEYETQKNAVEFKNYSIEGKAVCRIYDKLWKKTLDENNEHTVEAVNKFIGSVEATA